MEDFNIGNDSFQPINHTVNILSINPSSLPPSAVYSCQLDGKGGARPIKDDSQAATHAPFWLHMDFTNQDSIDWINSTTLLPELVKDELIAPDPIPKVIRFENGILVVLRGMNITEHHLIDPVVTFRFYITNNLIISTRYQRIDAIAQIKENFSKDFGPVDVADWLIEVSELISEQISVSVDELHNRIVLLEDAVLTGKHNAYKEINYIRKQLINLRRLLMPQRDIFTRISTERIAWIDENDRKHLHNLSNQQNHYIADIDSCLLRLAYLMEQVNGFLAESTNKRIYLMTLFTMVFMPITFLASLLGVNLSGIPFNEASWAFGLFCLILIILGSSFAIWLKLKKWM